MQHEIDEEMMDADKDEDELDETDVVEDEEDIAQSSTLESSQMEALASTQSENVVALTDGTQVRGRILSGACYCFNFLLVRNGFNSLLHFSG